MKLQLTGRIENAKNLNGNIQTIIATPAPDAYSKPQSFLLRSKTQLGNPGQEVTVNVALNGFVKLKPFQNKQTGMQDEFWEGNTFLDAELAQPQAAKPVKAAS